MLLLLGMNTYFARVSVFFVFLIMGLFLGEGLLRMLGFLPHEVKVPAIASYPEACLSPHPQLGLALRPGKFQITINDALTYECHHLSDSTRATRKTRSPRTDEGKKVFFFGCSLTYGMGLPDSLTFPFLIQKQFPQWKIDNFAVPAYGTLQSYLQLKQQLRSGNRPDLVILNYTSFHDGRNKLSIAQQKYWSETFLSDSSSVNYSDLARFPYIPKVPQERLKIEYLSVKAMKTRWNWSHYSSLIKMLEIVFDNILDGFEDKQAISQKIILEFLATCRENKIPLIITGIANDPGTQKMLAFCQQQQIPNLGFDHDLLDKKYNLYPHDSHPNAQAHQLFAQKLLHFLRAGAWKIVGR